MQKYIVLLLQYILKYILAKYPELLAETVEAEVRLRLSKKAEETKANVETYIQSGLNDLMQRITKK